MSAPDETETSFSQMEPDDFAEPAASSSPTDPFFDFSSISEQQHVSTTLPQYFKRTDKKPEPVADTGAEDDTVEEHAADDMAPEDDTLDEIPSDVENIDNVPSPMTRTPGEYRTFSLGDASALQVRSIDQRFQTRLSSLSSVRSTSSSTSSLRSSGRLLSGRALTASEDELFLGEDDGDKRPWETVRWSKLRKISSQIFSESAQRAYGKPTCIVAAARIVLGMSHGHVLVFDYHQTLTAVIGSKTKAVECGPVTALAVSADLSYIASGYSSGHIFTWELAKPTTPNIHISPLSKSALLKAKHSDGHLENAQVIYLNFIGKRHSALVSGDVLGMAFSHDTVRSMVGRTVITRRIMGRYPGSSLGAIKKKPTTLLACSPLPLGNVIQPTDKCCLVAIMTPYLLAIVSVLPTPRTEFKTGRPKSVSNDIGLSGCVSWLPALKSTAGVAGETNTRLAYSWGNVLTIMEVIATPGAKKNEVSLKFNFQKRYVGNEAIVSIQWISRQVLGLVTSTQRLLFLNERTMAVSAKVDLLSKHLMHTDYFSEILKDLTFVDSETGEIRPVVVCDGYFNSVRGFKGKLFLLGKYELVAGTVSNWADRLLDTMELGDYIGAIDLATSYYLGTQDLAIVGLPMDDDERHAIVIKNLPGMMIASIKYTFNGSAHGENVGELSWEQFVSELCEVTLEAWIAIGKPAELLEQIFEEFEEHHYVRIFFETLTRQISSGRVTQLPPIVFRELVKTHAGDPELAEQLEEVICSLDIGTLDVDAAITLARQHHLKDTLIYIWNHALGDYVTPLVEFIDTITRRGGGDGHLTEAEKVYPYLSYILSGRVYPTGLSFEDERVAFRAKSYVYYFLFASSNIAWPQGGPVIYTCDRGVEEPVYPYLTVLLRFNTAAFFAALNEAFEDPFLNDAEEGGSVIGGGVGDVGGDEAETFGLTVNRQLIVNILLEVFGSHGELQEHRIFFNIFLARNYPKYTQFIILPGQVLTRVVEEVCNCGDPELKDECELSLESLLSKYKPYDLERVIGMLQEVKFYGVLQYVFRGERRYNKLLETAVRAFKAGGEGEDEERKKKMLDVLGECLRNTKERGNAVIEKERVAVEELIRQNFGMFVGLNARRVVRLLSVNGAGGLHDEVFQLGEGDGKKLQFDYLDALFNLGRGREGGRTAGGAVPGKRFRHLYVKLLCERGEVEKLFDVFKTQLTGGEDVDLEVVGEDLEKAGAVDSLVLLLQRQGRSKEALESVLSKIGEVVADGEDGEKYVVLGVEVCRRGGGGRSGEGLWIRLIDGIVELREKYKGAGPLLQTVLSALLDRTGSGDSGTIVRICTALLQKTPELEAIVGARGEGERKTRTVGAVRPILRELFAAYRYQERVLTISRRLLDGDAYGRLCELVDARGRGWRVAVSGECEGCGRAVVGLGVDAEWVYGAWEARTKEELGRSAVARAEAAARGRAGNGPDGAAVVARQARALRKGKGRGRGPGGSGEEKVVGGEGGAGVPQTVKWRAIASGPSAGEDGQVVVVFRCGHAYHLGCLRNLGVVGPGLKCVIDG